MAQLEALSPDIVSNPDNRSSHQIENYYIQLPVADILFRMTATVGFVLNLVGLQLISYRTVGSTCQWKP